MHYLLRIRSRTEEESMDVWDAVRRLMSSGLLDAQLRMIIVRSTTMKMHRTCRSFKVIRNRSRVDVSRITHRSGRSLSYSCSHLATRVLTLCRLEEGAWNCGSATCDNAQCARGETKLQVEWVQRDCRWTPAKKRPVLMFPSQRIGGVSAAVGEISQKMGHVG